MQLVGLNPSVEAWRSERLLQKLQETATFGALGSCTRDVGGQRDSERRVTQTVGANARVG
jgi:hypothetical protein